LKQTVLSSANLQEESVCLLPGSCEPLSVLHSHKHNNKVDLLSNLRQRCED